MRRSFLSAIALAALLWYLPAPAQTVNVLYNMTLANGATAFSGLTEGTDGYLYGTATTGGEFGNGTIFRISKTGSMRLLHSFGGSNGAQPFGQITLPRMAVFMALPTPVVRITSAQSGT